MLEYLGEDDASEVELPEDFVLQEIATVDLAPDALAAFTQKWGPLTGWGGDRMFALPAHWIPPRVQWEIAQLGDDLPPDGQGPRTTWMAPVSAVALHIRMLRIMAAQLKVYLDPSLGDFEDYKAAWVTHGFHQAPVNEAQAWMGFDTLINAALRPFHANVQFYPRGLLTGATPAPTLYQACALQLYNYVVEQAPIRQCARERCGKPFTMQRGRSRYGQHRTSGIKYCSAGCTKAQNELDRRRRRRGAST